MTTLLAAVLVAGSMADPQDRSGRDVRPTPVGTATVSGVVMTDSDTPVPLRRARVTLRNGALVFNRTIVTDETGRFEFQRVPAGEFTLAATKEAFVNTTYGARRPGGTGTPLAVADGVSITGLTLRLPRGAVITGTVVDGNGHPLAIAEVRAMEYAFVRGERQLTERGSGLTDDRGIYRIFGLRPGRYYVMAPAPRVPSAVEGDLLAPAEADIDRALKEIDTRSASAAGVTGAGRPVGYSPIYYPNVISSRDAAPIDLAAGQERAGVDLQIGLIANGRVEVTVVAPEDVSPVVQTTLIPAWEGALTGADGLHLGTRHTDGVIHFATVPPGEYLLTARANRRDAGSESALGAAAMVTVSAEATSRVALELGSGFTIRGRIELEGGAPLPQPLRSWRIAVTPTLTRGAVMLGNGLGEIQADGTFAVTGVMPGTYRLVATPPPAYADTWLPRVLTVAGRDVLEGTITINSDVSGVHVFYTNRIGQISGKLADANGVPADYHIIVFPADPRLRTAHSSRIQAVRASSDGSYAIKRLLPGEYLLAAVGDVEPGEWLDPLFLEHLVKAALPFTLADGEQKVQNLATK